MMKHILGQRYATHIEKYRSLVRRLLCIHLIVHIDCAISDKSFYVRDILSKLQKVVEQNGACLWFI